MSHTSMAQLHSRSSSAFGVSRPSARRPSVLLQATKTPDSPARSLQKALGDLSGLGDGLGPIGLTIGGIVVGGDVLGVVTC